jgi:hypothetical protein
METVLPREIGAPLGHPAALTQVPSIHLSITAGVISTLYKITNIHCKYEQITKVELQESSCDFVVTVVV